MKFNALRFIICIMLICSMPPITAKADEMTGCLEIPDEKGRYSYISPFAVNHSVFSSDGELVYSGFCAPKVYRLTGEGTASVTAYCTGSGEGSGESEKYCRFNLEDSPGFPDSTAEKLRAIILAAYPQQGTAELQSQANAWLREKELQEIRDLQSGEAILAAQIAVWKLTGGKNYSVHALYGGIMDLSDQREQVISQTELSQGPTRHTQGNVESLYTYFSNLPPAEPAAPLVSDASVARTVYSTTQEMDGSCSVEVLVTVKGKFGQEDDLTILASCAGQTQQHPLVSEGEYRFRFAGLERPSEVLLEIRGEQYGEDVFLFATNEAAQAGAVLVGYDSARRPVQWERILTPVFSPSSDVLGRLGG